MIIIYIYYTLHTSHIYIYTYTDCVGVSTKTLLRRYQDFALDDSDEEEPLLLTPEVAGKTSQPCGATGLCKEGV